MGVIISNGATNLSTASGFYRVESHNMSSFANTWLNLSTTRYINVTFANAGNCKGIVLAIFSSDQDVTRDVTVVLQENTGTWVDRATSTVTANQISNSTNTWSKWYVPFEFSTPYAVDTASNKWRFQVSYGAGLRYWYILTSNGTTPFYATWCDNAVSFTDGDCVIAKEKITIDRNATFTGVLGTGDSTNSVCALACRSTTPTLGNDAMFEWENTPASSYTLIIKGWFVLSAHAGFRAGTSASRIPLAQQAIIDVQNASVGTANYTGFSDGSGSSAAPYTSRMSIAMYGEIPTMARTTLSADANSGQKDIVTTDSTGWSIGDKVFVSKGDHVGVTGEYAMPTITAISGTNITLSTNLSSKRLAGGYVCKVNGYGVVFKATSTQMPTMLTQGANNAAFSGCEIIDIRYGNSTGGSGFVDDPANIGNLQLDNSSVYTEKTNTNVFWNRVRHPNNLTIDNCNFYRCSTISYVDPTPVTVKNCVLHNGSTISGFQKATPDIHDNFMTNSSQNAIQSSGTIGGQFYNNYIFGHTSAIRIDGPTMNFNWYNNTLGRLQVVFWAFNAVINCVADNDTYLSNVDVIVSPYISYYAFVDMTVRNATTSAIAVDDMTSTPDFSSARFQNLNGTNKDFTYMPYGTITRTGTGLADTTVRTAGGYAMKFTPLSSTNLMHWEQNIPTGDIQTKTMTVTCWVKINNSAYYAGTHTKPTLTVTYDQTTTITSTALGNTDWQQLACTFTPTTGFGQIQIKLTANTDATGTNRDFYVDDFNIAYPAGVAVDLGGLDLWANGLPVAPAIATVPSLAGVWDEPLSAHTVTGTAGKILADAKKKANIAANR